MDERCVAVGGGFDPLQVRLDPSRGCSERQQATSSTPEVLAGSPRPPPSHDTQSASRNTMSFALPESMRAYIDERVRRGSDGNTTSTCVNSSDAISTNELGNASATCSPTGRIR